jgi:hypothetical protein
VADAARASDVVHGCRHRLGRRGRKGFAAGQLLALRDLAQRGQRLAMQGSRDGVERQLALDVVADGARRDAGAPREFVEFEARAHPPMLHQDTLTVKSTFQRSESSGSV